MGQGRHDSAATTRAIGAAKRRSQVPTAALSREIEINPRTVAAHCEYSRAKFFALGLARAGATCCSFIFVGHRLLVLGMKSTLLPERNASAKPRQLQLQNVTSLCATL